MAASNPNAPEGYGKSPSYAVHGVIRAASVLHIVEGLDAKFLGNTAEGEAMKIFGVTAITGKALRRRW
jgi:hypothetical protein